VRTGGWPLCSKARASHLAALAMEAHELLCGYTPRFLRPAFCNPLFIPEPGSFTLPVAATGKVTKELQGGNARETSRGPSAHTMSVMGQRAEFQEVAARYFAATSS
jgi:hypothetical protein